MCIQDISIKNRNQEFLWNGKILINPLLLLMMMLLLWTSQRRLLPQDDDDDDDDDDVAMSWKRVLVLYYLKMFVFHHHIYRLSMPSLCWETSCFPSWRWSSWWTWSSWWSSQWDWSRSWSCLIWWLSDIFVQKKQMVSMMLLSKNDKSRLFFNRQAGKAISSSYHQLYLTRADNLESDMMNSL